MTQDEIISMAREAGFNTEDHHAIYANLKYLVELATTAERRKHQADIEKWKAEAATAEKWRGLALSKDGDGRCVQRIQQEAAEKEREACALLVEKECAENWVSVDKVAAAIRARGQQ